jgi:hypothetical protein
MHHVVWNRRVEMTTNITTASCRASQGANLELASHLGGEDPGGRGGLGSVDHHVLTDHVTRGRCQQVHLCSSCFSTSPCPIQAVYKPPDHLVRMSTTFFPLLSLFSPTPNHSHSICPTTTLAFKALPTERPSSRPMELPTTDSRR